MFSGIFISFECVCPSAEKLCCTASNKIILSDSAICAVYESLSASTSPSSSVKAVIVSSFKDDRSSGSSNAYIIEVKGRIDSVTVSVTISPSFII